jgi:3-oxoacyl-[acyl-carrier-protein] synthase-1
LGACTSLGQIVTAAAAFRAGLQRARELPDWTYNDSECNEPATLVGHPASWCTEHFEGNGRRMRMVFAALDDFHAQPAASTLPRDRVGMILCLPELSLDDSALEPEDFVHRSDRRFLDRVTQVASTRFTITQDQIVRRGRIGWCVALRQAAQWLERGDVSACIIGAVDSLVDPLRLPGLWARRELKTADRPDGLSPGEAAVFLAVRRGTEESEEGAVLIHMGGEVISEADPALPTGLAAFEAAWSVLTASGAAHAPAGSIYHDLNGQAWRASDWGCALVRFQARNALQGWRHVIPAEGFGDTGAASGALAVALATRAFVRGYAHGRHALIMITEENGERAALLLERRAAQQ